jgi:predicted transcriptional regulator
MLRKKNTKRKHDSEIDENFLKRIMGRKEEAPIETPKSEKNQVGFRYDPSDFDPHTMMHRSDMEAMDNEFRKRKESPQPAENQPREKRSTMSPEAEKMDKDWGALGAVMGVDPREAQRLSDMMKGETNEVEFEKEMEEGNAFTDKLRHTPKGGKFKLGNKEYTDNSSLEEEVLYKLQSGKDSELFTESEIVDMIEQIIMEEKDNIKKGKTPAGLEAYEKAHKGSGKENDDYMKEFTKKITEYTKDGSKEKFTTDAKHFPKGNGELEKMSKKAYVMSDNGKEFLEDYMSPGMEDLVPEEIEYDEDWVKDNIKGSSRTGNNPEWANAVETDLGEKLVKKQKAKKFHKAKETAYRKSKQPVTDGTGENSGSGVNIKLESVDKKTEKLNEEFNRMKSLIGYSQRTQ